MDLKEIAEAYQLVYEKKKLDPVGKEDDDVDNDGDVDSSDEYLKKRRAAIGKAMGKDGDKEEDEEEKEDKKKDKKESLDLISAYKSMYEHHQKDEDGNVIPHPIMPDENGLMPVKPDGSPVPAVTEGIDLSFVDELSEEELDTLVEEVVQDLLDEGIELDAIEGAFTEYLEEAKVTYGSDTEDPMVAAVKKRKEEKAKASKEKAEKFKKSVAKTVNRIKSKPARMSRGLKAKAHGKLADYAGKRGLMPTKSAEAAKKPTKVYKSKKYKTPEGEKKYAAAKAKEAQDLKKYNKVKDKKQTSGNIKVSMMGGGAKTTRQKLRSAVFKDVKDRVGKKVGGAVDKVKSGVKSMVKSGRNKTANVLFKIADKIKKEGRELDMFDTVTAYLIDEGLVKDFDHAQRVMTTLDSTLIEEVHAEQMQLLEAYTVTNADKKGNTPAYQGYKAGKKNVKTGEPLYKAADHMKNESLEDAYLKVYEGKGEGFGEKPEASEKKGEKKEKPKKEKITQQQRDFARKTFGGFNRKFGK